jgi:hypothetical protein
MCLTTLKKLCKETDRVYKIMGMNIVTAYEVVSIISGTGAANFMQLGGHATLRVMVASGPEVSF